MVILIDIIIHRQQDYASNLRYECNVKYQFIPIT